MAERRPSARHTRARPTPDRNVDLAKIHMAAGQLGLIRPGDDSTYRAMLWSVGRVHSAKDLDAGGRQAVLTHLRGCGWVDRKPASRYVKGSPSALIRWLWSELHRTGRVEANTERALRRYIAAHLPDGMQLPEGTRADEIAPQHLDTEACRVIIEQLKRWLDRREHKEPAA